MGKLVETTDADRLWWENMHKARAAILAVRFAEEETGTILCPVCNIGRLTYIIMNNHVHGACSTNGCVTWVE